MICNFILGFILAKPIIRLIINMMGNNCGELYASVEDQTTNKRNFIKQIKEKVCRYDVAPYTFILNPL